MKPSLLVHNRLTLSDFANRIEREFTVKSAIDADLFAATVQIVADVETLPGGDVISPIHDALNWRYTRFGNQARSTLYAALLLNEDGSCWQAKLSTPLKDVKGKNRKYEAPVGNGSRAFLPEISAEIRQRISDRYGVEVPLDGSFWNWLAAHPEIPIVFTEGGKKALALLSLGYVAIALYGVNGGYRNIGGDRFLTVDLERFAGAGRKVLLAFDQDAELKTQRRVNTALIRFGLLLKQAGAETAIVSWDGSQGKGADDLIVNCGADAFHAAYAAALSLEHWQIWRRLENRLTYPTAVRVNRADLSTLDVDRLPSGGIIAIAAAKGTGKTKLLSAAVSLSESVLSAGHRIALMRNLCERLKIDYRGDLDKVNGRFINGSGYALRIGFCVDALLAIDLSQFAGCDLILDEVVQMLRHLLTSSTCNKEGMRPLLLARFAELVKTARRVIVADADLDNATLHYLRQLRGDDAPVFLIRNDYQAAGYSVRFIESRDSSAAIAQLLADVDSLQSGKVLFVATDSKRTSASIDRLIQQQYPGKRVLLLNSDTSGGEIEQAFIRTPDAELQNYDVVIASPSLATGVSIEAQGIVDRVYGIFSGGSSTDADMAQALCRVREPIDRIVWCAKRGTNFSKASRSANPIELKSHLQQQTSVAASLVKLSLTDTTQSAIAAYDWAGDAHLNLYCHFAAEQNRSMLTLRDALLVRLRHEGHHVLTEKAEPDAAMKLLLRTAKEELRQFDAEAIAAAEDLTYIEVAALEKKESRSPDEELAIIKFRLKDDYCIDSLTLADILADKEGQRRAELLSLEAQLYPDVAIERTARGLEKQAGWKSGNCPWDLSGAAVRQAIRRKLGLDDFLTLDRAEWTKYSIEPYAARARQYAKEIAMVLHFTITPKMSDVQIIHQLLSQLGVKVGSRHSRAVPGYEGEKLRVYSLDVGTWQAAIEVLERRKARRDRLQRDLGDSVISGSPPQILSRSEGGDPSCTNSPNLDEWLTPESLADVRMWLQIAPECPEIQETLATIPDYVKRAALAA